MKKRYFDVITSDDKIYGFIIMSDGFYFNFSDICNCMITFDFSFTSDNITCHRDKVICMKEILSSLGIPCTIETILVDQGYKFLW